MNYNTVLKMWSTRTLAILGLAGFVSGCNQAPLLSLNANVQAQDTPATATPLPTQTPTTTPSPTTTPTATLWPTTTPLPSATPWAEPQTWSPVGQALPSLEIITPTTLSALSPLPVTTKMVNQFSTPYIYSPPDGVDVFGDTILRWKFKGELASDEYFDIKIRPYGSERSAFVDWTKSTEYTLRPWSGWQPGIYTWEIGIIKGHKEGDTKHFLGDTGRNSESYLIKWQPFFGSTSSNGGGSSNSGGSGSSGGGGGGSSSGGS